MAIAQFSLQKISAVAVLRVIALSACQSGSEIDNALGSSPSPSPMIGISALSLSPSNYNFGLTSVGQVASPLIMVIQNVTGVPIYLSTLNGTADPDFFLSQLDCPSGSKAIAPGGTCRAKINFVPLVGGNPQYQVTALFGPAPGDTSLTTNTTLTGIGVDQVSFAGLDVMNPANLSTTTASLTWLAATGASSYT